jgi:FkbM family methyltransferase
VISYAQNLEDVVLARALAGRQDGFYIDVGAWDPVVDSVTKHFYDAGWRGINLEPSEEYFRRLEAARPRDVNLMFAVTERPGKAWFHSVAGSGLSSLQPIEPAVLETLGLAVQPAEVDTITLAQVCAKYAEAREIDFLKIDAEGGELAVINGADWSRFRPRILVIEAVAVDPRRFSPEPSHDRVQPTWPEWEPRLVAADYEFCLFDGLNRFYVRREDGDLKAALQVPANVLDGYVLSRQIALEQALVANRDHATGLEQRLSQTAADLSTATADLSTARADLSTTRADLSVARADLAARDIDIEFLGRQLESLSGRVDFLSERLESVSQHRDDFRAALESSDADRRRLLASAVDLEQTIESLRAELAGAAEERHALLRELAAWRERVAAMEQTSAWRWRERLLRLLRTGRSGRA